MKTLPHFSLVLLFLLHGMGFAQTNKVDRITKKYSAQLAVQNQGVAILVKKNDSIATSSLGAFDLTANTVFNIGSATKTFTAILILQEVEKGNLQLSDPISAYLNPIPNVAGTLSIASLLSHESGLGEVIGSSLETIFYAKNDSLYELNIVAHVPKNKPEKIGKFDYCNTNYILLGKILEKVTDQSYFDLLRERIFMPLKMKDTYPYVHKNIPHLAVPFHDAKAVTAYLDHRYFANIAYAAGSIASTLLDMETFYTALFETELLLKKESLQMMMTSGNDTYGYGLFKPMAEHPNFFGHGGNNIGYAFRNGYNPATKELYLLFSNSRTIPLQDALITDVHAYLNNKVIESFQQIDLQRFKKYVGNYLLKEADLNLSISLEDDRMYLISEAQGIKGELTQKSETVLYDTTVGVTLTIIDGENQNLTFQQNGFTTILHKMNSKD